jgi:hypothetical protein
VGMSPSAASFAEPLPLPQTVTAQWALSLEEKLNRLSRDDVATLQSELRHQDVIALLHRARDTLEREETLIEVF